MEKATEKPNDRKSMGTNQLYRSRSMRRRQTRSTPTFLSKVKNSNMRRNIGTDVRPRSERSASSTSVTSQLSAVVQPASGRSSGRTYVSFGKLDTVRMTSRIELAACSPSAGSVYSAAVSVRA